MEERVAFIAKNKEDLTEKLVKFLENQKNGNIDDIERCYRGAVKLNKEILSIFTSDAEIMKLVDNWVEKHKYEKLLELWIKGFEVDWFKLYLNKDSVPNRISLPTYPFSRDRYWVVDYSIISNSNNNLGFSDNLLSDCLHPLVHKNISNFNT